MKRRGFTLIELLVVIAIIAILAAILFPVFAQAREKARQTTCSSNLKQIGLGILQYQQDFDESFPMAYYNPTGTAEVRWYQAVGPYIKNGTQGVGGVQGYAGSGGIWSCPDAIPQFGLYGANASLIPPGGFTPASLSMIEAPSDTIVVAEKGLNAGNTAYEIFQPHQGLWMAPQCGSGATAANNYTYASHIDVSGKGGWQQGGDCDTPGADMGKYVAPAWNDCDMMPRYRHAGNSISNFLFSDGHVRSMQKGSVNWFKNIYVPQAYSNFPGGGAC